MTFVGGLGKCYRRKKDRRWDTFRRNRRGDTFCGAGVGNGSR